AVVSQLEGFEAAAAAWETELLPARVGGYEPAWLDDLCLAGRVVWTRLHAPKINAERGQGPSPVRSTPITLVTRKNLPLWNALAKSAAPAELRLSSRAQAVADFLPADRRKPIAGTRRRRTALFGVEDAGRWALIRRGVASRQAQEDRLPRET